jgi:serine/threonine-protein kinase
LLAARAWEKAGQPAKAARVLEAALRAGGDADPDRLRVALGTLYEAHGKHQAAARVLQLVAETSEHRRAALGVLLRTLAALGLRQAIRDLEPELRRRGVDGAAPERVSQPSTDAMLYGRYRIVREVATTPHARLIEAVDTLNGVPVAVKIMASSARGTGRDALARFVREAQALTRLRHANVVPLYDFVAEGPAMVLAWMRGGSLRDLLDREAMSPARAAEIARAVLDALSQAHRLGILHRDVKPSNLLFDEAGTAKLADFGAAHMATSDATVTVGEIGTVAYMAPEQRRGHAATVASDVYAVGVMLHEMLTGAVPAQSGAIALSAAHPDLDEGHEALLARMLAREPGDRPSSALDVRHAVEALVWSTRVMPRSARVPVERAVEHERLIEPRRGGDRHDVTLGRDVLLRPLDADSLARASAFARAAHEALPTVLRADRAGWLWIDAPRGRPLSQGLTLDDAARERLRSALTALHEAGGVHGAVDRDHVFVHAGAAYLAYPPRLASCAPQDDLRALAAL